MERGYGYAICRVCGVLSAMKAFPFALTEGCEVHLMAVMRHGKGTAVRVRYQQALLLLVDLFALGVASMIFI
jgi:hypothetical protein